MKKETKINEVLRIEPGIQQSLVNSSLARLPWGLARVPAALSTHLHSTIVLI